MTKGDGNRVRLTAGATVALAVLALSVGVVGVVAGADASTSGPAAEQAVDGQVGDGQAVDGQVGDRQVGDGQVGDGQVDDGQSTGEADDSAAVEEPETDNTVTRIEVREDGSARWHVRVRTRLATEEDVNSYEAYQERVRENRTAAIAAFREHMERVVTTAGNVTGREMAATNFSVSTSVRSVPRRWGITTTSFTWEGFARTDGQKLQVGDAFEDGYFIAGNDTLQLRTPDGYELSAVSPPPDESTNGTAVWVGRVDFGTGEPAATVAPAAAQGGDGGSGGLDGTLLAVALLAAVVAVGAPAVWYRRRAGGTGSPADGQIHADGPSPSGEDGHSSQPAAPEPITDGERVRRLVEGHGGRMKQADIVDQVDWSKSKVSRVLGDLADDGVVEKTRIGRENVVSLVEDEAGGSTGETGGSSGESGGSMGDAGGSTGD